MGAEFKHKSVLVAPVLHYLRVRPGGVYVDCTLGGAGHARYILDQAGGAIKLVGIDRDPEALQAARERLEPYGQSVVTVQGNFRDLTRILDDLQIDRVDGILADLGVSSHQLDSLERGFSIRGEELDMRMGPDAAESALDLVNRLETTELAYILKAYGEERWADRIAREIVTHRTRQPIQTASELSEIIKMAIPAATRRHGPHPARRSFQALRIAVNDELGALKELLATAIDRLVPGGRLVVISFHSLEDRLVKRAFADAARGCVCPPQLPVCVCNERPLVKVLTRKPVLPDTDEVTENPRARSSKLRAVERVLGKGEEE